MDLNQLVVFVKVVQAGSFIRAARELGMPKSTVSRKVSELETRLGARLLQRSTRTLSLTDSGRAYFAHAERVVSQAEDAEAAVTLLQAAPRGLLRVTAPLNFSQLGPITQGFLERYPDVQLEMLCTDRVVDLITEGFDVALRVGRLADSSLIARPLGSVRNLLVASPTLLKKTRTPQFPRDLRNFPCLAFGGAAERSRWELVGLDGKSCTVPIEPRFVVNDFEVLCGAAIAGLGVALLPSQTCAAQLRGGRLWRVLPEWSSIERPLQAVYPSGRHVVPKLTAFLDHLAHAFSFE